MKKILAMLVVGAVVGVATADITQFNFSGGTAQDQGTAFDGWSMIVAQGNASSVSDLGELTPDTLTGLGLSVAGVPGSTKLPFQPVGTLSTDYITGNGSLAGSVFGILVNKTGVTGIGDIAAGDFIGLTADFDVIDLQPGGSGTVGLPQSFNPGVVDSNLQVIPEPATIGMMGVAGLGMFLARRKARR